MAKTKKRSRKKGAPKHRVWPAFLLLGALGALVIFLLHPRAPGGDLNAQGLRLTPSGRSDASHVVAPERFPHPRVSAAYRTAREIPETLNQLYCWCGCIERGMRSALECFESDHGAACEVCLQTARIAGESVRRGVRDAGEIQRAVDVHLRRV